MIATIIRQAFPPEFVAVVEGGRAENQELLEQRFDYIFFTGGVTVGRLVMEKAARYLTPVTLELGGKSPCIVDSTANLKMAAKRLVFGKYLNSGQTCVAPDYLLVQESVKEEFLVYVKHYIRQMFGEAPLKNPDYPRMINEKHYRRVMELLREGQTEIGGYGDEKRLQIAPTVLTGITEKSPVMQEEIFGPVLPVLTCIFLQGIRGRRERFSEISPLEAAASMTPSFIWLPRIWDSAVWEAAAWGAITGEKALKPSVTKKAW